MSLFHHTALRLATTLALGAGLHAQAGETTNRIGITLVDIPAGSFVMGACLPPAATEAKDAQNPAPASTPACLAAKPDPDADPDEGPQHKVRVAAFKLAKTEVTLGQFKQFIQAAGRADLDTAEFRQENRAGDQAPVVHVSWNDAQDFIQWLNRVDGGGYRLPSEAEWEYACRAGRNQRLCGSNDAGPVAWYDDNSDATPHPVATRQPNAWGLHDMSGNAFEWVQDCWHYGYENAPSDARAWVTPCDPLWRVLKGGSWYWDHTYIRATTRITDKNTERNAHFGFRLARSR